MRRWPLGFVGRGAAVVVALVGLAWALVIFAVDRPREAIPSNVELETAAPVAPATPAPIPTLVRTPPRTPTVVPRPPTPTAVLRPPPTAGDLGEFGVWRRDGDQWVDLVPWTHSNVVRSGGSPNDLTVRAIGPRLTFTINGVQVASVEDDALTSGGVGIFVGGDYNEVALDHFAVHLPD